MGDYKSLEFREAKKDCYCRGCNVVIEKGTKMIAFYSFRNRGQYIYLCEACIQEANGLIVKDDKLNNVNKPFQWKDLVNID